MTVSVQERSDATVLMSRYVRAVDTGDTATVVDCFTDDATVSLEGGAIVNTGRAEVEAFFRKLQAGKQGITTHLVSNYGFERTDSALVVHCVGIFAGFREEGVVTMKGISYVVTCVVRGADLRIQKLEHSSTWECAAPGGPRQPKSST